MEIFRAYDIRGVYPNGVNEEIMERIGRAFADFIHGKNIAVGYDARPSSLPLFNAFVKGVLEQGKDVIDFGLTSTPMGYFASCHLHADGTAVITASHNPKDYNGVKFTLENAIPVSTGLQEIKKKVIENNFKKVSQKGVLKKTDVKTAFAQHLSNFAKNISGLRVVVDPANGLGAQDYSLAEKSLDVKTVKMFFDIDGEFPNHDPNPMKEGSLNFLRKKVVEEKADLGIAFDGDADRVFFIDDKGAVVSSDIITILLAQDVLSRIPNSTIIYDIRSSRIVTEKILEFKGVPKLSKAGHGFFKEAMHEFNAPFAGELSGHFYFAFDFSGYSARYDSGIIAAIKLMNLVSAKKTSLSSLVRPLKKYSASGEINFSIADKDSKLRLLADRYKDGKISWFDGIRVDYQDWWFNVRVSNNEPLLRLNLEAKTGRLMKEKLAEISQIIRE